MAFEDRDEQVKNPTYERAIMGHNPKRPDSAEFSIIGAMTYKYVAPGNNFAAFKIEVKREGRRTLLDCKSFDTGVCNYLRDIGVGEGIEVTGDLGSETLKNKAKLDVQVDGYSVWQPMLKVTSILKPDQGEQAKAPKSDPMNDDDIPF